MTRSDIPKLIRSSRMVDELSADGHVVFLDEIQAERLGLDPQEATGMPWSRLYTQESRDRIAGVFASLSPAPRVLPVTLRAATGGLVAATAVAELFQHPEAGLCLRLCKWPKGGELDEVAALAEANEVLSGIVAASADAGWCMEWAEPVDLSAPEHEIVRQVFENGPRWRFCNDAMARLYRAPPGEDFNSRPVAETFPRTPENEEFIRRLIRADFYVNGSPSRDRRYDGVFIDVENDVRGHIRGNRLFRMWGTVRDVSRHLRREAQLRDELAFLQAVLGALPDPVLVADRNAMVIYANMAAEALFEAPAERICDRRLTDLLAGTDMIERLLAGDPAALPPPARDPFAAEIRLPGGRLEVQGTAQRFELNGGAMLAICLRRTPRAIGRRPRKAADRAGA